MARGSKYFSERLARVTLSVMMIPVHSSCRNGIWLLKLFAEGFQWGFAHARGVSIVYRLLFTWAAFEYSWVPSLLFVNTKLLTLYHPFAGEEESKGLPKADLYMIVLKFKALLMLNTKIQWLQQSQEPQWPVKATLCIW